MSDDASWAGPDLHQFEPDLWSFTTSKELAAYIAAFDALREAAREAGLQSIHARIIGQPDVQTLNMIADLLRQGEGHTPAPAVVEQISFVSRGFRSTVVAEGVIFVEGPSVNWVIVAGDHGPVLIDTGYPDDRDAVRASLHDAGWTVSDLVAILITHGHGDHIGTAADLAREAGCPVYAHEDELPNIRRDVLEQVSIADLLPHPFRPGVMSWALHAMKAGGRKAAPVPTVAPFPLDGPDWEALGVDVRLVPIPGHTRGHAGYLLPAAEVLVVGDALVTAHPTSPLAGPQLLPSIFHGSPARAANALQGLAAVNASIVLPGHGPAVHSTPAAAAARALHTGSAF